MAAQHTRSFGREAVAVYLAAALVVFGTWAASRYLILRKFENIEQNDVSRSVDHPKFLLQREGYAAAISDPMVMEAIKSGPHQRIAVCFVEWSGFGAQKLVNDAIDLSGILMKKSRR